jgi:hypothetical protein
LAVSFSNNRHLKNIPFSSITVFLEWLSNLVERIKMNLFSTGLVIIGVAWLVQLISVLRGNQSILKAFVAIYILGVLLLVINDFREGINWMGWFEVRNDDGCNPGSG